MRGRCSDSRRMRCYSRRAWLPRRSLPVGSPRTLIASHLTRRTARRTRQLARVCSSRRMTTARTATLATFWCHACGCSRRRTRRPWTAPCAVADPKDSKGRAELIRVISLFLFFFSFCCLVKQLLKSLCFPCSFRPYVLFIVSVSFFVECRVWRVTHRCSFGLPRRPFFPIPSLCDASSFFFFFECAC